ncbi:class I SAM-dependent rRNA methyltransferase [Adhaeribacter sp. BT258]|uniref:Class I SAM-dependent rRNA methyltransferase n=1 Tax=Adhaeribacter terrigena TaxID=2793070 RepID=A0ABS1BXH5_9BACT|nr:class I SAM-dependent rRNA methyltransferase [Adhaeribacter terrigena]MBK0401616.1 class I SAM-dependent rRNA methyltransferase [Adhaeribacter terrigena]
MSNIPHIILAKGKEHSLLRFHPWVFSGAVKKKADGLADGDVVEVYSAQNEFLGTGHYQQGGSIVVRVFSFEPVEVNLAFWEYKIGQAYTFRTTLGLTHNPKTNVYRLVFAEGDGLPGLVIDVYGGTAVLQAHTIGMYRARHEIAQAIMNVLGENVKAVYDKSAESLSQKAPADAVNGYLLGDNGAETIVKENGNEFYIDWVNGQKTGFFVDQRENRELVARYSKGKNVLNTFCYTGGFSVYALNAGAELVHSVDSSKRAIELTERNAQLSGHADKHEAFAIDTFDFLKRPLDEYDVVILDPPAFAKHLSARHNAVMGYKRLNAEALKKMKAGSILFTFSCSQVVDKYLFENTLMAAAIEAGRSIKIMHQLSQPADHPISIFCPEGEYLKGLVLYVE